MRRLLAPLLLSLLAACAPPGPPPGGTIAEFQKIDTVIGNGTEVKPGDKVSVHYTGWLYDENAADKHGGKFDSSVDCGTPLTFTVGAGKVIRGWDEGLAGMKEGGKRTLLITPEYGYGARGAGGVIPPNASLVFDVELLKILPR
ncbi:FKBP-type peptidyl-prolyl cis-trans isomerase [Stenotrophomonas sp. YIM B06876]|uniref:FKBP-type peptidyl-prolyl cis-trans isomerase n=1 Tax=Stenotrophomonas sp. YIM B06876 TaxID=3060211 RepID=UPI00273A08C5|nr:FKBP-type peptidyl-prolyl cis-trans isomerase [Stenotrophomonas sp. YIM B06876]